MKSLFEREEGATFTAYSDTASEIESQICTGLKFGLECAEDTHGSICIREFCAIAHAAVSMLESELSYDRRREDESRRHQEKATQDDKDETERRRFWYGEEGAK